MGQFEKSRIFEIRRAAARKSWRFSSLSDIRPIKKKRDNGCCLCASTTQPSFCLDSHCSLLTTILIHFTQKRKTTFLQPSFFSVFQLLFTHTCPVTEFAVASHLNTANSCCHHVFLRHFRFQKCLPVNSNYISSNLIQNTLSL